MTEDEELRPEFIARMKRRAKQKAIRIDDFAAHFGLKPKKAQEKKKQKKR